MEYSIAFIGAGKMAEGLLAAAGDPSRVLMAEKLASRRTEMARRHGVATTASVREAAAAAPIVVLAVRPQDAAAAAREASGAMRRGQTLVSIVAGRTLATLRADFGPGPGIVRVMPNLALRAGAGMCAVCAAPGTSARRVREIVKLLSRAGEAVELEERHFDAVTALSGSGPAYFAYMRQAMAEGGVALGLPPDVAGLLAAQTMYGTAKFLKESGADLASFIDGVCTKGGTTAAGMAKMAKGRFKAIVAETLKAAAKRSAELARAT